MPAKINLDENLWFLYTCLQKSNYSTIDYAAVAGLTGIKPPAARMRFARLKAAIEGGTLIGTHGKPFVADSVPKRVRKRKTAGKEGSKGKEGLETGADAEDDEEPGRWKPELRKRERGAKIKGETADDGVKGESDVSAWESGSDVPLAKKRRRGERKVKLEVGVKKEDDEEDGFVKKEIGEEVVKKEDGDGIEMVEESAFIKAEPGLDGAEDDCVLVSATSRLAMPTRQHASSTDFDFPTRTIQGETPPQPKMKSEFGGEYAGISDTSGFGGMDGVPISLYHGMEYPPLVKQETTSEGGLVGSRERDIADYHDPAPRVHGSGEDCV
ncbi:hypothetical protein BJ546DRAFT_534422 [Cryomyces antarcticus]